MIRIKREAGWIFEWYSLSNGSRRSWIAVERAYGEFSFQPLSEALSNKGQSRSRCILSMKKTFGSSHVTISYQNGTYKVDLQYGDLPTNVLPSRSMPKESVLLIFLVVPPRCGLPALDPAVCGFSIIAFQTVYTIYTTQFFFCFTMEDDAQQQRIQELEETVQDLKRENQRLCRRFDFGTLPQASIERYSRQLLIPNGFGVSGQLQLEQATVLVVGAGGIGCGVLPYLVGAGIGKLIIMDGDVVERSNLHRQVLHETIGINKALSAQQKLQRLNPEIVVKALPEALTSQNALELCKSATVVVDASDNPLTRYLINDACVLAHVPLISGSAVGTQGQITVYNSNIKSSGCYRCLYPQPDIQAGCQSCSDAGVLGPVPGLIGILQAMETIKVLTHWGSSLESHSILYDSGSADFLKFKKPPRRVDCRVCGEHPDIQSMEDSQASLEGVRGPSFDSTKEVAMQPPRDIRSVTCTDYHALRKANIPHLLLDVRVREQFELCSLPGSVNVPLDKLLLDTPSTTISSELPVYCICRRGIASAEATHRLHPSHTVYNIEGGYNEWHKQVDPSFPYY